MISAERPLSHWIKQKSNQSHLNLGSSHACTPTCMYLLTHVEKCAYILTQAQAQKWKKEIQPWQRLSSAVYTSVSATLISNLPFCHPLLSPAFNHCSFILLQSRLNKHPFQIAYHCLHTQKNKQTLTSFYLGFFKKKKKKTTILGSWLAGGFKLEDSIN